jgi:general secretion pathway protein L
MRESILALFERPQSLQVLRLERSRGGLAVTGAAASILPPGTTPGDMAATAAGLIAANALAADQIILGLDGGAAVLRRLPFPFTAQSKIDLVLGPEFEPYLVTPLPESALSWTPTSLASPPAAVILAAAVPLEMLVGRIDALTAHGLPPSAACLDLAGLDAVLADLLPDADAALCVSLLDGRADFVCRLHGASLTWRSLAAPAGDTAAVSAFLAREAALTLSAMASLSPAGLAVTLVGDAGQASHAAALAQALGTPTTRLAECAGWPTLPGGEALPDADAAVYGLALLAAKGSGTANFLRGELTPALSRSSLRRAILVAGGSLALLAVCGVAALLAAYWRLDAAIARTQDETGTLVAAVAPELTANLTLPQKLSVLRGRLAEQTASARDRAGSGTGAILEILAAIHQGLGADGTVQARRIAADDSRVTIDAVADDYTTVDAVKRRLSAVPVFASVEIRGAKNVPDKKQVEFQLDLRLAGGRGETP